MNSSNKVPKNRFMLKFDFNHNFDLNQDNELRMEKLSVFEINYLFNDLIANHQVGPGQRSCSKNMFLFA